MIRTGRKVLGERRSGQQHLNAVKASDCVTGVGKGEGLFVKLLGFILFTATGKHLVLE